MSVNVPYLQNETGRRREVRGCKVRGNDQARESYEEVDLWDEGDEIKSRRGKGSKRRVVSERFFKRGEEEVWKINVDASIRSAPTVYDNKLLSLTISNKLYVLNIENGNLLWQHQGIFNNTTLMNSPKVAVDENIVIVP